MDRDHVDRVRHQWAAARPDVNTDPFGVVGRVGRLAFHLDRGIERLLAEYQLDRSSWDILASLRRAGPPHRLTPTELYRALMRTSGAITYRLHQLEERGLVERVLDPDDHRSLMVALTAAGRELVDTVLPAHMDNEHKLLSALSRDEQETLAALLRKLLLDHEREPHSLKRRRSPRGMNLGSDDEIGA